jgi:hypothetical protein
MQHFFQQGETAMTETTPKKAKGSLSRRSVLKGATATAAFAASTTLGAPMIWAQNIRNITLRQFGTGVSNLNEVAAKVQEDLGFTLEMTALDTDSVTQRAATSQILSISSAKRFGQLVIFRQWILRVSSTMIISSAHSATVA